MDLIIAVFFVPVCRHRLCSFAVRWSSGLFTSFICPPLHGLAPIFFIHHYAQ
ncbi:MAG: hypothetical protein KBT12_03160 [Bacteroidales bacterium]|nr:hypothetical protein [Candidatus Physcousia equi]